MPFNEHDRAQLGRVEVALTQASTSIFSLGKLVCAVLRELLGRKKEAGAFRFIVGPTRPKKETTMPLELSQTIEQKTRIAIAPVTSTGKPAKLDGPAKFEVVSGNATIEPIDDASCFIVSGDTPGDSAVLVSGDADLGAGVVTVSDTITMHDADAQATALGLAADAPIAK